MTWVAPAPQAAPSPWSPRSQLAQEGAQSRSDPGPAGPERTRWTPAPRPPRPLEPPTDVNMHTFSSEGWPERDGNAAVKRKLFLQALVASNLDRCTASYLPFPVPLPKRGGLF